MDSDSFLRICGRGIDRVRPVQKEERGKQRGEDTRLQEQPGRRRLVKSRGTRGEVEKQGRKCEDK